MLRAKEWYWSYVAGGYVELDDFVIQLVPHDSPVMSLDGLSLDWPLYDVLEDASSYIGLPMVSSFDAIDGGIGMLTKSLLLLLAAYFLSWESSLSSLSLRF